MSEKTSEKERAIEVTLEIAAPVESVWKAITDPKELERWFPLQARVTPGVGGEVFMSWGPPWEGGSRIEAWDENRRLRTRGFLEHGDASMVEYTLEAKGGKTLLRLVHSGFAKGGDWEDELFGGTERGWRYELRSLRHYLERHAGKPRLTLWPKASVRGSAADGVAAPAREAGLRARGRDRRPERGRPLPRHGRDRRRVRGAGRRERPALRVLGDGRGPERRPAGVAHARRRPAPSRSTATPRACGYRPGACRSTSSTRSARAGRSCSTGSKRTKPAPVPFARADRRDVRDQPLDATALVVGEVEKAHTHAEVRHRVHDLSHHRDRTRGQHEPQGHPRASGNRVHRVDEGARCAQVADPGIQGILTRARTLQLAREGDPLRPSFFGVAHACDSSGLDCRAPRLEWTSRTWAYRGYRTPKHSGGRLDLSRRALRSRPGAFRSPRRPPGGHVASGVPGSRAACRGACARPPGSARRGRRSGCRREAAPRAASR